MKEHVEGHAFLHQNRVSAIAGIYQATPIILLINYKIVR